MLVYSPPRSNRHLHIRDALLLALRVLEVNRRDGHSLTRDELELVDAIAVFSSSE